MNAKESKKLICPFGHTDEVIPCVTGLVTNKEMNEKHRRGEIYLSGCIEQYKIEKEIDEEGKEVSRAIFLGPNGYCKKHKIIF